MKQHNGKLLCAAHGCQRVAICRLTMPRRVKGRQPYPVYSYLEHAQSVPSARTVMHQYGFMGMMDFSPYFKDAAESS
jgi:hypothetical protein